ncbi:MULTISPECIES: DUF742 domain-containing protein [unclassified Streptomyces]|uniref:DUF742 domain-containing protein n=1 Tax=unclassified Streptomyces TaxID=2593676 RepID=UPI002DDC817B|nr:MULTISPECIES: DUF742 domain-containing protein [unclassified Streptomyces]WSA91361.1 DUF742 domain-containing protein [Streptomyces sp. NBC_01795]WSB75685.1 DUF742 domain-containing protein [Streptomyces sp. NBC_01775]WSS16030.1 DUF742 domain-containing protein [Streptomyces sp. NBC_01186]WSS44850.1 DUF742 domain-containing protein [Streptomyces sp. NBC_01187]
MSGAQRGPGLTGLERYYVLTGGRSRPNVGASTLDVATLIVARSTPATGVQPEHDAILRWSRDPLSVAELGAHLGLPFNILSVLVADLLNTGRVEARDPIAGTGDHGPDLALLEEVLSGLQRL